MFVETKFFHKAGEGSGGGSDPHNLGYYADLTALQTAHPTGTDGDFAILGSTDTIWVWDSGTSAWKDTDTKGQVTSVNGQTGDVTVDALPDQTGQSGKFLTTDGTNASWSDKPLVNKSTQSSSILVSSSTESSTLNSSNSVRIGTLSFGRGNGTVAVGQNARTNGSDSVAIGKSPQAQSEFSIAIGSSANVYPAATRGIAIGNGYSYAVGAIQISTSSSSKGNQDANTFKVANQNGNFELMSADGTIPSDRLPNAINKYSTMPTAASTNVGWIVQFTGTTDSTYTHGYIYECKAQGTDPETYAWEAVEVQAGGGGQTIQVDTLPTASAENVDKIYQYVGATGNGLTNGSFYKCFVYGSSYEWRPYPPYAFCAFDFNHTPSSLNMTTTGEWGSGKISTSRAVAIGAGVTQCKSDSVCIGNTSSVSQDSSVAIGAGAGVSGSSIGGIAIGYNNQVVGSAVGLGHSISIGTNSFNSIAIGGNAKIGSNARNAIQLGPGTNSEACTFYVAGYYNSAAQNYKLLDADGTIPAARHATLPAADGTYTLQLVIADGVPTLSWVAV